MPLEQKIKINFKAYQMKIKSAVRLQFSRYKIYTIDSMKLYCRYKRTVKMNDLSPESSSSALKPFAQAKLLSATEKCKICGDQAARHIHYGAMSCFSCRFVLIIMIFK